MNPVYESPYQLSDGRILVLRSEQGPPPDIQIQDAVIFSPAEFNEYVKGIRNALEPNESKTIKIRSSLLDTRESCIPRIEMINGGLG